MASESKRPLEGRVAVVTGGASGIGAATVRLLSERGASVVIFDRDAETAEAVRNGLLDGGSRATVAVVDVTERDAVDAAVGHVVSQLGAIDIVVNCAGLNVFRAPQEVTEDLWSSLLSINLSGTWHVCAAAMPHMIAKRSGRIVNIGSAASLLGIPHAIPYTAAKHGVVGLTRALAVDLGPYGITVNCVCPGPTMTPLMEKATSPVFRERMLDRVPLARLGRPEDIASAIAFLASDEASWISGASLPVDGGLVAVVRAHHFE